MTEPEPAVSVVVPAHDAAATIARTLDALAAQQFADPYEVIVVDDGSSDETADRVRAAAGPVRLIEQEAAGAAAARNRGVAEARGRLLAFTDADCIPTPGWLAAGVRALADADLVVGAVLPDPNAKTRMGPWDRSLWVLEENGLYETANLLVRREALEAAGGFEGWLEHAEGRPIAEDLWLGWRVRRSGARTAFCADALVHHAVFRQRVTDHVRERLRLRFFADIAARVPEIRDTLFFAHWFLNPRTAAFDAALLGAGAALWRRSALPLLTAVPYAAASAQRARRYGRVAPKVVLGDLAADAVGCAALVAGSLRSRSLVL